MVTAGVRMIMPSTNLDAEWLEADGSGGFASGTIGGERPNALDFQIAPSVRLAMAFDQFRDGIAARPAGAHALRVCPDYPGRFRDVLPAEWISGRSSSVSA